MTSRFLLAISTSSGVARVAAAAEPLSPLDLAGELFSFEITDYKSQSAQLLPKLEQQLQAAGYATDPAYAEKIMAVYQSPTLQQARQAADGAQENAYDAD